MKYQITGWIYYKAASKYSKTGEPSLALLPFSPKYASSDTWGVPVREHSIEVEIPDDFDPRPQQIAALEKEKQRIRAEFAAKVTEIDTQIQRLLALEMS